MITVYQLTARKDGVAQHYIGFFNAEKSVNHIKSYLKWQHHHNNGKLADIDWNTIEIARWLYNKPSEAAEKYDALWNIGHELNSNRSDSKLHRAARHPRIYGNRPAETAAVKAAPAPKPAATKAAPNNDERFAEIIAQCVIEGRTIKVFGKTYRVRLVPVTPA